MTNLYHFTHQSNLESILASGGLLCDSAMAAQRHAVVGNRDIKGRRAHLDVTVAPHGVVADYVPFYFAPRSPMLYVIHKGTVPACEYPQNEVIYLCTTVEDVVAVCDYCYTDRNAALYLAEFYKDISHIHVNVDMPLMSEEYWNNTPEDLDRMERRMAEFLVHRFFPWNLVKGIGVYGDDNLEYVQGVLAKHGQAVPTKKLRHWYF
ncbi:type II toxin-antitoxin system toxin DNA ADP-ribosyl transferase DarT [Pseudodesulfovibrio pelocollis]|uniref:type II toxin-antitoxin system toxin DNA ADP-ribosyl transferase DarT n=1 Tax=Pseudodesulfovibrio pelocollis TaxID=3051432 RepID=UPI00255A83A7|nr:DUF4433 domain-containing protein [Pseudodesulfovibrio sp. SB368]